MNFCDFCDLCVCSCPSQEIAIKNVVVISIDDYNSMVEDEKQPLYLYINNMFYYTAVPHAQIKVGYIGLNKIQRALLQTSIENNLHCKVYKASQFLNIVTITVNIDFYINNKNIIVNSFDGKHLINQLLEYFKFQVWSVKQKIPIEFCGTNFILTIDDIIITDDTLDKNKYYTSSYGIINQYTVINLQVLTGSMLNLINIPKTPSILIGPNFNFKEMGIGGLDDQFAYLFRRVFASRIYPTEFIKKIGINHVRGMLLYGPPGTGKTLIARQIGQLLNCHSPKIVMGPEILNKFVGQSEENVRMLF
mgnify:CR=1 FL=1